MKKRYELTELIYMTLLCVMGVFSKRFVSPLTNLITDFIRVPGGSLASGFSFVFLVAGMLLIEKRTVGTLMGGIQGLLAMVLGIGSFQGIFAIVIYMLPGIAMDVLYGGSASILGTNRKHPFAAVILGITGNLTGSLTTNFLFFQLDGIPLLLWFLLSAFSGGLAGYLAYLLYRRVSRIRILQASAKRKDGKEI